MTDRQFDATLSLTLLAHILIMILLFTGCSADNSLVDAWNKGVEQAESQAAADQLFRDEFVKPYFEKVGEDQKFNFVLYRDVLTDVMYVTYSNSSAYGRGAALSVMYAADGSPLLYPEWLVLCADQEVPGNE